MISDVFFANRVKDNPYYYFDEKYLLYKISIILNDTNCNTFEQLVAQLEKIYVSINQSKLKKIIGKHFMSRYQGRELCVLLKDEQKVCLQKLKKFKNDLFVNFWEDEKVLFSKISSIVSAQCFNVTDYYSLIIALDKKKNNFKDDYYEALFFDMYFNYKYKYCKLDEAIEKVSEDYFDFPLNYIIDNKLILNLLFANEINVIYDLKNVSIDSLLLIFANNTEDVIFQLKLLEESFTSSYKNRITSFISLLKPAQKDVIFKRYGFGGFEELTLEVIGSEMNVTRERVRQIEAKGTKTLLEHEKQIEDTIIALYNYLNKTSERYLERDVFINSFDNKYIADCALLIIQILDGKIKYNKKLKIIFNSEETSADELINEVIDVLGNSLSADEMSSLNSFEKNVVSVYYHEYQNGIYLKNGLSAKDVVLNLIDTLFPNGYKISDEEQYSQLKNLFEQRYGSFNEIPSQRSIVGFIDRGDYCQIDRGTYKNRVLCATIDDELKDDIINYILVNKPMVHYQSIYETFKYRLSEIGVANYYYLKGIIDPFLPNEFNTKRDYIYIGDIAVTSSEVIANYMRSFNGVFTIDGLREKFIGVKDYTLYNVVYKEEKNGLIWLSYKKFIYISSVTISKDAIKQLDLYIEELMNSLGAKIVTSRKIFGRLSLTNKDLLDSLKIVNDQYSMFSFIKYHFKDKYYFKRPLISLEKQDSVSAENVIANYVKTLDNFNLRIIKKYTSKMNIRGLYSYLKFMDELSDDFVQINVDTMVKKDRFETKEYKLNEFKKMLALIFLRTNKIDTQSFNGFGLLPQFEFKWNKHLFAGIIRSFFDSEYEIEYTSNFYDKTDYVIRRIK